MVGEIVQFYMMHCSVVILGVVNSKVWYAMSMIWYEMRWYDIRWDDIKWYDMM